MLPCDHIDVRETSETHAANMIQMVLCGYDMSDLYQLFQLPLFFLFCAVSHCNYPSVPSWMISHRASPSPATTTIAITPTSTSPSPALRAPNRDMLLLLPWTCWNHTEVERRS